MLEDARQTSIYGQFMIPVIPDAVLDRRCGGEPESSVFEMNESLLEESRSKS